MANYCTECGNPVEGANFCPNCGTAITEHDHSPGEIDILGSNPAPNAGSESGTIRRVLKGAVVAAGGLLIALAGLVIAVRVLGDADTATVEQELEAAIADVSDEAAARVNDGKPRTAYERRYSSRFEMLANPFLGEAEDGYGGVFLRNLGEIPSTSDALLAGYATCVNVERAGNWDPIVEAAIRSGGGRTPASAVRVWMLYLAWVYLCDPYPISDVNLADLTISDITAIGHLDLSHEVFTAVPGEVWASTFDVLCELVNLDELADVFFDEIRPPLPRKVVESTLYSLRWNVCEGGYPANERL